MIFVRTVIKWAGAVTSLLCMYTAVLIIFTLAGLAGTAASNNWKPTAMILFGDVVITLVKGNVKVLF